MNIPRRILVFALYKQRDPWGPWGKGSCDIVEGVEKVCFVECRPKDDTWPEQTNTYVIDHHGDASGRSPAIMQVLEAIQVRVSDATLRWCELIGANDAGHIPAMLALGASNEEVMRVRKADWNSQGITPEEIQEADRALGELETEGRLTIARMSHSRTAPLADPLFGKVDQLLILSENGETNFYGDGELCSTLEEKFNGWSGGAGLGHKGQNAFWGSGDAEQASVLEFVREVLTK